MWIKQPLTAPNRLRYRFRQGKLHGEGEKAIKQGGPFGTTQEIVYSDGWANGIKALLAEDPGPFDFDFFRQVLRGEARFGRWHRIDSGKTGWVGELFGLLVFLRHVGGQFQKAFRITQVGGSTKYPDFVVLDPRNNHVELIECKAAFVVPGQAVNDLDLCAILDDKRQEGRAKAAHVTSVSAGDTRFDIAPPLPADSYHVMGSVFLHGRVGRDNSLTVSCPHGGGSPPKGCRNTCAVDADALFVEFRNPWPKTVRITPPEGGAQWFALFGRLLNGAWAGAPFTFFDSLREVANLRFEEHARAVVGSYCVKLAAEHMFYVAANEDALNLLQSRVEADTYARHCWERLLGYSSIEQAAYMDDSAVVSGPDEELDVGGVARLGREIEAVRVAQNELRLVSTGILNGEEFLNRVESMVTASPGLFKATIAGPDSGGTSLFIGQIESNRRITTVLAESRGRARVVWSDTP